MSWQKFKNVSILIYYFQKKSIFYSVLLEVAGMGWGRAVLSQIKQSLHLAPSNDWDCLGGHSKSIHRKSKRASTGPESRRQRLCLHFAKWITSQKSHLKEKCFSGKYNLHYLIHEGVSSLVPKKSLFQRTPEE